MQQKGFSDYETFRKDILYNTGVSFCTRLHFGKPYRTEENKYIRFAYTGIGAGEIKEGLGKFRDYINNGMKAEAGFRKSSMAL